jgi:hydrogenase 3 maturation protease
MLAPEIILAIGPHPTGKTAYILPGNTLRGDDAAGPYIAGLINIKNQNLSVFNVMGNIENYLDDILSFKPAKVVIIDAAHFSGIPGELRIIPREMIPGTALSTHGFSPLFITRYLETELGCEVVYLGIQIRDVGLGSPMAVEVKKSADEIAGLINNF